MEVWPKEFAPVEGVIQYVATGRVHSSKEHDGNMTADHPAHPEHLRSLN